MSFSSSEEEFELNYVKIDSNNDIRLLVKEDFEMETITFMTIITEFGEEKIGKNILSFLKKTIPDTTDILKANQDYTKQFLKTVNMDKKKVFNSSVNRILSTDFKDKFIFNKTNLQDVCNILTYSFNEIKEKKYKILNAKDFKNVVTQINFDKYDFFKIYANNDYLKNKDKEKIDQTLSRESSQCKSTTFSSYSAPMKDLDIEPYELDEKDLIVLNRYHNEAKGIHYIDYSERNIICSSKLTNNYNYNEEEELKKLLNKECFLYPKNNNNTMPEQIELPIELLILLDKLKNVKTLIFQIQNIDELFMKFAILVLINIKWLFLKGIEEVKFDLGNEEIQQGLVEKFNERTRELYHYYQKNRNLIYYNGSYQARTINCWDPEEDIFFEKFDKDNDIKNDNNKKMEYLYSMQPNGETSTFDNHLCNIYNEFGNLTNLKYIRPFKYAKNNKFGDFQYNQKLEDYENSNLELNISVDEIPRLDRESISINSTSSLNSKNSNNYQNTMKNINNQNNTNTNNNNNANNANTKSTPQMLTPFINKYKLYFDMILIYCHFFSKNIKKIKKLSLYFHTPFSYEICLKFNMRLNFDQSHFLIMANQIETLTEANFSFNAIDDKSFEYILGIIFKNTYLSSLKISFFTPDINYFDDSLFNLISSKKISLTKLFQDQMEYEIKNGQEEDKKINNYILNEKLLEPFATNLCIFFNILKIKTLNNLEELILRFDIPLPLLDNQKYLILIVKFLTNILIMLTFQENKIKTLKLLAPYLELNGSNMPYIRQLFKEISLKDEIEEKMNDEKEIKKKKTTKQKELKEQREKENEIKEKKKELKDKNSRKELLEKINSKDNISQALQEKKDENDNDKDEDYDVEKNYEIYDFKRYNSVIQKKAPEKAARRQESFQMEELSIKKRSELSKNICLEHLTMHFKIYDLPEIFNICIMNNLSGLKSINLGNFDEITFIGFINNYRKYINHLTSLTSLKICLGASVTSYISLEKYILEFININSPVIEEKFLFSDLNIINENKMRELIELVYEDAVVPKLVIQIGTENFHLLSKILYKFINEKKERCKEEMISMIILMDMPEFQKLYNQGILECLSSFYGMRKNRAIICKDRPLNT